MIQETLIEEVLENLENADFSEEMDKFKSHFPVIYTYLLNDQLESLTEEEFQLLFFDALVIVRCFEKQGKVPDQLNPEQLEEIESANWNLLQNSKPVNFTEKLDVFFQNSRQEDLLAFIEDSLVEDEDQTVSSAAREIIFIFLKSIVDLLDQENM